MEVARGIVELKGAGAVGRQVEPANPHPDAVVVQWDVSLGRGLPALVLRKCEVRVEVLQRHPEIGEGDVVDIGDPWLLGPGAFTLVAGTDERVEQRLVHQSGECQRRPVGVSTRAGLGDLLAGSDLIAGRDEDAVLAQKEAAGLEPLTMIESHEIRGPSFLMIDVLVILAVMGRHDDAVEGGVDRNADQLAVEGRHQSDGGDDTVSRVVAAVPVLDAARLGSMVKEMVQVEVHARPAAERVERKQRRRNTCEARMIIGSGKRPELRDIRLDPTAHPRPVEVGRLPACIVIGRGHDATKPAVDGTGIGAGLATGDHAMVLLLGHHRLMREDVERQSRQHGQGDKAGRRLQGLLLFKFAVIRGERSLPRAATSEKALSAFLSYHPVV